MSDSVQVALIGILSLVVASMIRMGEAWWNKRVEKKQKDKFKLTSIVNVEFNLNNLIVEKLNDYRADRVFIARFHNGGKYVNGVPMERFSITNSVYSEGHFDILPQYQGRLINDHSSIFQKLIYEGYCRVNEITFDQLTKSLIELWGEDVFLFEIKNIDKSPVGFLGICFEEPYPSEQEFVQMNKMFAQTLLPYLNVDIK